MPARGKLTDEAKTEQFEAWKNSAEYTAIENFQKQIAKLEEQQKGGL